MQLLSRHRHVPLLDAHKQVTAAAAISALSVPEVVVVPLRQHIGEMCDPTVSVGDRVRIGDVIGESTALVTAAVHATVSGRVLEVAERPHPLGGRVPAVVIESDGRDEWTELVVIPDPESAEPDELRAAVRRAGIAGMAGAGFPAAVKLGPPREADIDTVIINAMEGEPYLSADHRMALEHAEEAVDGVRWIMRMVGAPRAIFAVEGDKEDAARSLEQAVAAAGLGSVLDVQLLPRDYAAGAEKILVEVVLGREIPSGGFPYDIGVVSQNVSTTVAISAAVRRGRPLIERVLTVAGEGVERPGNYLTRIGTTFDHVLEQVGVTGDIDRVIMGGPMMGIAQSDLAVPVIKPTTGILALSAGESRQGTEVACIHCAWCVEVCPIGLMPYLLVDLIRYDEPLQADTYHIFDCFECGLCDYVCPSNIPLVEVIRGGKSSIREQRV
ncbi:MAG: electron transport complex subunit RsxC [Acidimicrobiia bacterium]|nr:MAG: electron transport complex subunit RsxC [Acidimicrobiia bacterium]